jgi:hypothetical protein
MMFQSILHFKQLLVKVLSIYQDISNLLRLKMMKKMKMIILMKMKMIMMMKKTKTKKTKLNNTNN